MTPSVSYDFRVPVCSTCGTRCQRSDTWKWHCPRCADEWLAARVNALQEQKAAKGLEALPASSPPASFKDIWPNRAARRRSRRSR